MTKITMAALPMVDATDGGSIITLSAGQTVTFRSRRRLTHRDNVAVNTVAEGHVTGNSY